MHVLKSLANLAKYTGRYDQFLEIRKRYNLKWSNEDPIQSFERLFNPDLNLDVMLQRIKEMIRLTPHLNRSNNQILCTHWLASFGSCRICEAH